MSLLAEERALGGCDWCTAALANHSNTGWPHRLDHLGTYTAPVYTLYSAIFISFLPQDPVIMHRGLDYRVRARKIRIHWATDFVVILSPWPSPGSHDQLPVTAPTHVRFTCHLRLVLKGRPRLKRISSRTPLSPRLI